MPLLGLAGTVQATAGLLKLVAGVARLAAKAGQGLLKWSELQPTLFDLACQAATPLDLLGDGGRALADLRGQCAQLSFACQNGVVAPRGVAAAGDSAARADDVAV